MKTIGLAISLKRSELVAMEGDQDIRELLVKTMCAGAVGIAGAEAVRAGFHRFVYQRSLFGELNLRCVATRVLNLNSLNWVFLLNSISIKLISFDLP